MNLRLKWLAFLPLMLLSALVQSSIQPLTPFANNQVTVKLVLGEKATLPGYQGVQDETIYHRNVVAYTAAADSNLPTPTKPGTTFVSWVYAQSSALVRVNKMPKTSGATYYAYWQGDGSLATTIQPSSSISSSAISSSVVTTSTLVSSSLETLSSASNSINSSSIILESSTSASELSSLLSSETEQSSLPTSSVAPVQFDVYLKVNDPLADWSQNNATFKIHYWGNDQSSNWNQLPSLTSVGNGIYHYAFFDYQPTHVLFQRRSSDQTIIWNMTIDYTYPGDDALLTITSWTSQEYCGDCLDQGTKSTGVWSTYSPA
ncbi:MAG: hypothetical protein ACO207_00565 [Bacilli bacterium]